MPLRQPNSNSCAHDIDISLTNGRSQCRGEKRPAETNRHGTGWRGGVARQDETKKRDRVGMHASMATPSLDRQVATRPLPLPIIITRAQKQCHNRGTTTEHPERRRVSLTRLLGYFTGPTTSTDQPTNTPTEAPTNNQGRTYRRRATYACMHAHMHTPPARSIDRVRVSVTVGLQAGTCVSFVSSVRFTSLTA